MTMPRNVRPLCDVAVKGVGIQGIQGTSHLLNCGSRGMKEGRRKEVPNTLDTCDTCDTKTTRIVGKALTPLLNPSDTLCSVVAQASYSPHAPKASRVPGPMGSNGTFFDSKTNKIMRLST
jgi:hypothetical protein